MRALSDRCFRYISVAGIFFQGGASALDASAIIAALAHGLTGAFTVGTTAAIARAVANERRFVLAAEPTGNLDSR